MSGLINSVKEAVIGKSNTADTSNNDYDNTHDGRGSGLTGSGTQSSNTYGSDNAGPHSSNLGNKLDPRVDSDQDGRRGYDSSNTSGSGQTLTGRVAEATGLGGGSSSNTSGSGQTLTGRLAEATGLGGGSSGASRTAGPHSSDLANKADPRVDSDQDGRRGYDSSNTSGSGQTLTGRVAEATGLGGGSSSNTSGSGQGLTGRVADATGLGGGSSGASHTEGPHSSDLANKADPRVDSDQDGRRGYDSSNTSGSGQGLAGRVAGMTGLGGSSGTSNTAGPHSSDLANKADPRVDSDQDGRRGYDSSNTSGSGQGLAGRVAGITGRGHTTEGHGHAEDIVHGGDHYTETANKLDPHVAGSGPTEGLASGTGLSLGSTSGTGHSQGTTEPHRSGLLNKVDPRVRSDNDGSNTYGGNQTT
jgi:hypothetical protein